MKDCEAHFMIETILLAMLIAKLKGYKLKPLFKSWGVYPVFGFVIIYMILNSMIFFGNYSFIKYAKYLEALYILTFLIPILKYKQYISSIIGSLSIVIGTLLNKIAMGANGGKMPVFPTLSNLTGYYKPGVFGKVMDIHILGSTSTKLKALTDFIDLGYSILSIGDVFIRFFTFIIIYGLIKYLNNQ